MPLMRLSVMVLILFAFGLASCGNDDVDPGGGTDPPLRSQEANEATLGGVRYRVTLFRQLNVRARSDRAYYRGSAPATGSGIYAAFVRACNVTDREQATAPTMRLLDAFGETFARQPPADGNRFAYRPTTLAPGKCLPRPGGVADRSADGVVVVFEVPFKDTRERPMLLEIPPRAEDEATRPVRVELDL